MTENPKEKQSQDYQFINEKIVPKRKSKWLRKLGTLGVVICMAVVFGLVSQVVFLLSGEYLKEWLGINEELRQEVDLPRPTAEARISVTPTPKPVKTPTPIPTKVPEQTPTPSITDVPEQLSPTPIPETDITITPVPSAEPTPEGTDESDPENNSGAEGKTENDSETTNGSETELDRKVSYVQMYEEISTLASEVSDALVTVEAIEQGVDWFQETYENRTRTTGLILANDGIDLLILVDTEQISGAGSIEVYFGEEAVEGRIFSLDKDYGLAVVAVPLTMIPEETFAEIKLGVLAEDGELRLGMPVLALGAPNGYEGSMEFGMVTSLGSAVSVADGEVAYFTTNIADYEQGYGFVVSLDGKILGMMTHTHKENPEDGIFSAVFLDSIRGVIVKLLNNQQRAYFGIKGQNLPRNLAREYELEYGLYVSEVENASPALTAGIKAGDIIVSVGNAPVDGIRGFSDVILECSTREIVRVKLLRKAEDGLRELTVEVALTGKN